MKNPAYFRRKDGSYRTDEEAREYMESLPPTPLPTGTDKEILKKLGIGGTISAKDMVVKQYKEIKRLNNIINELEKEFDKELENLGYREEKLYTQGIHDTIIDHKYLLQELKGRSDKE